MNIIGQRKIFYIFSGMLLAASLAALAVWGLKLGLDFTGGSLLEVEFGEARPAVEKMRQALSALDLGGVLIQPSGERAILLRFRHVDEVKHQEVLNALGSLTRKTQESTSAADSLTIVEKRFDTIGPTIGRELGRKSLLAIGLVILLIVSYIAFAFRKVSLPVSSWKYGVATVIALLHDVIIPAGFFAVAGRLAGFEVDTLFITAILTILGFSVHDTIVVFDRIRENLKKFGMGGESFEAVVNRSVNETMTRSINTSLTVLLALAAVYFFGGASTRVFSLTLIIGIFIGTYSSIFIASPILVSWHKFKNNS